MRSLDILSPMRPKPEPGRTPAGDDPRPDAAPGFEAAFDAFEGTPKAASEAPAEKGAASAPEAPAENPLGAGQATTGTTPSLLEALMALTGPRAPAAAPVPEPDLAAMVQRAAAQAGATPAQGPEPTAPKVSLVGLETHFAPVRPHTLTPSSEIQVAGGPPSATAMAGDARPFTPSPALAAVSAGAAALAEQIAPARAAVSDMLDKPIPPQEAARNPAVPSDRPAFSRSSAETAGQDAAGQDAADGTPNALSVPAAAPGPQTAPGPARPSLLGVAGDQPAPMTPAPTPKEGPSTTPAPIAAAPEAPLPDRTAHPPLGSPAMQGAAPDPLRGVTGRGRARTERAETAGSTDSAELAAEGTAKGAAGGAAHVGSDPDAPVPPATSTPAPHRPEAREARIDRPAEPLREASPADSAARVSRETTGTVAETAAGEPARAETALTPAGPSATGTATAALPPSPQRQIVDAVAAQLPPASTTPAWPSAVPGDAGPLKILTLQLHPADLGTVLVRMRLQDGRLEMNLRTSREDTAERLRNEGDLLSGLLREAGYEPEAVTIQSGSAGPQGDSAARGQGFSAFAGSQGGQHDRQPGAATPDQSGRRPSPRADAAATATEEQDHETETRGRDRGGLYL